MVAAMGILGSTPYFRHQAALYKRRETRSRGACRQADALGDMGS